MKKNIGSFDRILRIGFGVVVAALWLTHMISGTTAIILLAVGAILLLTGLVGTCPIYLATGLNTNSKTQLK